jgi:hypothetical protein
MSVSPAEDELDRIVDAWIAYYTAAKGSPERKENWWAVETEMNWMADSQAELLWEFVNVAYKRELPDNVIAALAAGPLENLLADHGPQYIDRVVTLARQAPKFNYLLGGVWKGRMPDEVWKLIEAIRNRVW